MAILMSFVALSTSIMMPALSQIGQDLNVNNPNDVQLIISTIFLGLSIGIVFFGPFSDSFGRKPAVCLGIGIYLIGCLASIFSSTFEIMIAGRFLQGLGAASCRVGTLCMVRDQFEGNAMARIMSFIMMVFIITPAIAPSIGQGVLLLSDWRAIFILMFVMGALSLLWLALGQQETLDKNNRLRFSVKIIKNGFIETFKNKVARNYTLAAGLVYGAFIGYLSSAQQILQEQYELGSKFPLVFGLLTLSIGLASYVNAKWVYIHGMEKMCRRSLMAFVFIAAIFIPYNFLQNGHPPLGSFLLYLSVVLFCFGLLIGNFNALAIQPLGHIAGAANSVIGSLQTLLSVVLGGYIGYSYNGTITPLIIGFFVLGLCALIIVLRLTKKNSNNSIQLPG